MSKKITLVVLVFVMAVAVIFTGCAPARKPVAPADQNNNLGMRTNYNNNTAYENYTKVDENIGIRDWNEGFRTDIYDTNLNNNMGNNLRANAGTQRADDVARACEQVQGVENATCVVTGNTAYVGIDLDANTKMANERDIKNEVAQMVRATGKDINTVYVSTEANFMDRLRNVGNGIRNGRPVDAFTTELNQMIDRISPTRW